MENGFDVAMMREMMARQAADANRIVILCDALRNMQAELEATRAKLPPVEPPK